MEMRQANSRNGAVHRKTPEPIPRHVRLRESLVFLVALTIVASGPLHALGQNPDHDRIGWVPRAILERPVGLRTGIGDAHEKVTTSVVQAQQFYDQGLNYLHAFDWIEAVRSFHQALRSDPKLAMAYVGMCDAYLELQDAGAARAALTKAQALSSKSAYERLRIEISARQLDFFEDRSGDMQKYFAYRKAVDDALLAYPADPWLWILRGFADEGSAMGHGQGGRVDTIAFYRMALMLSPDNSAAHHYLAHTYENLGLTQQAADQSAAYVRQARTIAHAHHMHGHELLRTGRTEEAIAEFREAERLEDAYYRTENIPAKLDWNYAHNLTLMALCYQSLGQVKNAEPLLKQAFSLPARTDIAEFNRRAWPEFLLDRGRPQEALEAANEMVKNSSWPLGRFAGHAMAGRALLALNRSQDAIAELKNSEQELQQLSGVSLQSLPNAEMLRAEMLLRFQQWQQGDTLAKQMEERIRAMSGPDAWIEAVFQLQSIARVARVAGDWELAEYTAQQMIQHDPSYAGGFYELALCASHRGERTAARSAFEHAAMLWSHADSDLPELSQTRQALSATGTVAANGR